jgi:hypothetical protein
VVTLDDVEAAARAIAGSVLRTPSPVAHRLSEAAGATVVVKPRRSGSIECPIPLTGDAASKERGHRRRPKEEAR